MKLTKQLDDALNIYKKAKTSMTFENLPEVHPVEEGERISVEDLPF
jgi:hypothetical protein